MKKIVLLILALITGCILFILVYNQRKNVELAQKLDNLPEAVINEIQETREDLSDDIDEDELLEDLDEGMQKIKNSYQKETDEDMPEDVEKAIEVGLVTEALKEKE